MALFRAGTTMCVITNTIIGKTDNVVCFPPFKCEPQEPAWLCYDACVLREAFSSWKYQKDVLKKVSDFWVEYYERSTAFDVVLANAHFLFLRSKYEKKFRLIFLQHAFQFDIVFEKWQELQEVVTSDWQKVLCHPNTYTSLVFVKQNDKMSISQKAEKMQSNDCINLSENEWLNFKLLVEQV